MLMNPPPQTGLGASPLGSPAAVNQQMIQSQTVPGLQSKPVLGRGSTGLGGMPFLPSQGPGMGGSNPMAAGNPALMQLLGR